MRLQRASASDPQRFRVYAAERGILYTMNSAVVYVDMDKVERNEFGQVTRKSYLKARSAALRAHDLLTAEAHLLTPTKIDAFVRQILGQAWFKEAFPYIEPPRIEQTRRGCGDATAQRIRLPLWARQTGYLLHELAHVIDMQYGRQSKHNARFCATLLVLVEHVLGSDKADALRKSYAANNVAFEVVEHSGTVAAA